MSFQLISKLGTLLRGGARETLEGVVDANALRILEQEVIDYEQALLAAKAQLTQRVAERMAVERELAQLCQRQSERETQLAEALAAGRDSEVEPLADRIAVYQQEVDEQRQLRDGLLAEERRRTESLRQSARELACYQRELRLLKSRQRGQALRGQTHGGPNGLRAAREALQLSLARLQQRGQQNDCLEQAEAVLERQLQQDSLARVDQAAAERRRAAERAAIIARVRQGAPVRPA